MTTSPSRTRSSTASWPVSAPPTWKTAASIIASARRWSCRPSSICRRRRPPRPRRKLRRIGQRIPTKPAARRRSRAARKKTRIRSKPPASLTPSELNVGRTAATAAIPGQVTQPGEGDPGQNAILSPSQLGYNGGFSGMFGGNKAEVAPFKGEPTRNSLTQPPVGLPDAVAEFCLRHRAEGIAEQGIQSGRR